MNKLMEPHPVPVEVMKDRSDIDPNKPAEPVAKQVATGGAGNAVGTAFGGIGATLKSASGATKSFGLEVMSTLKMAGAAYTAFGILAVGALAKLTLGTAQTELSNELLAAQMWMNVESATAYKNSLDALGVSVNDLFLSPELMQKYMALRQEAFAITPPGGYSSAMKGVRDITFQWDRLKLEISYGAYWIGYYLTQYLSGPLSGINFSFKGINDWLQNNVAKWTQKIAEGLAIVIKGFDSVGVAIKFAYDILSQLAPEAAGFIALFTAGWVGLLNPLTLVLAAIAAIMLLMNDYSTYEQGGKSSFGDVWKQLDASGIFTNLKDSLSGLVDSINRLFNIHVGTYGGSALEQFLTAFFTALNDTVLMMKWILDHIPQINTTAGAAPTNPAYTPDNTNPDKQTGLLNKIGATFRNAKQKIDQSLFKPAALNLTGEGSQGYQPVNWSNTGNYWLDKWNDLWGGQQSATAQAAGNNIATISTVSSPSFAQNINIYGATDPNATGNAVASITSTAIIRGMQGVQK
jgi:hypothetical protein